MSSPSALATSDEASNMNNANGNSNGVPSQRRGRSSEDGAATTATNDRNRSINDDEGNDRLSRQTTLLEGLERRTRVIRQLLAPLVLVLAVLLRIALWPLRTLSRIVFPSSEFDDAHSAVAADRAATAFSQHFRRRYLAQGDSDGDNDSDSDSFQFSSNGYQSTLSSLVSAASSSTSTNSPTLLLVYLHSPLHRDADTFASKTLCDPTVMNFLNAECHPTNGLIRPFGASIHTADGVAAATSLQAGCYPHLSLLSCRGSSSSSRRSSTTGTANATAISAEVLLRLEGDTLLQTKPGPLVAYLQAAVQKFREIRTQQVAAQLQREEAQRLRTEQDHEYQRALEADRAREEQRRQEEAAAREAERKAQEEADRVAQEEADRLEKARELAGGPEPTDGPLAKVRLTLPSGERMVRAFRATDTVAVIRAFLILQFHEKAIPIVNFSMSTNFPKRVLEEDGAQTLQELGLCPQAVVMIQDLDA